MNRGWINGIAVMISVILGSVGPVHAGDACKNVKFKVTNEHSMGGQIEVRRLEYFNKANGAWQTEGLRNLVCNQGRTCTTSGDNLRDSEGEDLTKFRFIYRYKGTRPSDNWSSEVRTIDMLPDNAKCWAGRTYGPGDKGWVIRGS